MKTIRITLWKIGIATILSLIFTTQSFAFATDSISVGPITGLTSSQYGYPIASCNFLKFNTGWDSRHNQYVDDNYFIYFGNAACPHGAFVSVNLTAYQSPDYSKFTYRWMVLPYYFVSGGGNWPDTLDWRTGSSLPGALVCGDNNFTTYHYPGNGYYQSFYICINKQNTGGSDPTCDHSFDIFLSWTLYCYP